MREGKPEHTRFSARGFLIPAAIAAGITLALALLRGGTGNEDRAAAFAGWSDAFFAAGVFTGGAGLLSFASADGLFVFDLCHIRAFDYWKAFQEALNSQPAD